MTLWWVTMRSVSLWFCLWSGLMRAGFCLPGSILLLSTFNKTRKMPIMGPLLRPQLPDVPIRLAAWAAEVCSVRPSSLPACPALIWDRGRQEEGEAGVHKQLVLDTLIYHLFFLVGNSGGHQMRAYFVLCVNQNHIPLSFLRLSLSQPNWTSGLSTGCFPLKQPLIQTRLASSCWFFRAWCSCESRRRHFVLCLTSKQHWWERTNHGDDYRIIGGFILHKQKSKSLLQSIGGSLKYPW